MSDILPFIPREEPTRYLATTNGNILDTRLSVMFIPDDVPNHITALDMLAKDHVDFGRHGAAGRVYRWKMSLTVAYAQARRIAVRLREGGAA